MQRFWIFLVCYVAGIAVASAQETLNGGSDGFDPVDPIFEHELVLEDLQRRLDVASMRYLIASEIAKIAEEESKTTISQAGGSKQLRLKSISEAMARQSNPGRISLVTSRLTAGQSRRELCDLKWFMAFQCNGLPECAVEMNDNACGGVESDGEPMNMTVQYACGKPEDPEYETRNGEFKFRSLTKPSNAYLTCY